MSGAPVSPSTLADWLRAAPPRVPTPLVGAAHRTAAQDSVIRFAMVLWVTAPTAALTPACRHQYALRLQDVEAALSQEERQALQAPLLAWLAQEHPAIVAIVARQFTDGA